MRSNITNGIAFQMDGRDIIRSYNTVVSMSNAFR
jgi:hypothetical protein